MYICIYAYIAPMSTRSASRAKSYAGTRTLEHQERACSSDSRFRQNQTHAATHNICGLCVPRRRCPVVPLSLRETGVGTTGRFLCFNEKEPIAGILDTGGGGMGGAGSRTGGGA